MDFNQIFTKLLKLKEHVLLILIILLAATLRIYHIGNQSAWLDEIHTLYEANPQLDWNEANKIIMIREGIPHFYFNIIRLNSIVFGHNIHNIRMVSAIFGIGVVIFLYLIGKQLANKEVGLIAALIGSIHPFLLEHSQDGRAYMMLTFFIVVSYYFLIKFLENPTLKNSLLLGLFNGFIVNTQPFGLLNIASIYFTIFIFLLITRDKTYRRNLLINSIYSGLLFLSLFAFSIKIIYKSFQLKSFWTPPVNYEIIKSTLIAVLGRNNLIAYVFIFSLVIFILIIIFKKFNYISKISFIVLINWLFFNIIVIIIKSYMDVNIVVDRYFIGSIPAFILVFSISLSLIRYKYVKYLILISFSIFTLNNLIIQRKFYNSIYKTQFDKVTSYIIENNINSNKIYSAYGWLMGYYLNSKNNQIITEITFEKYVDAISENFLKKESFWYMDGNFRPYALNSIQENFLNENYIMDHKIELYDTWARHYRLKNENIQEDTNIHLNSFLPLNLDENGNLFMFENGSITSSRYFLKTGKFNLTISANSFPETPINNENAHIKVLINNEEIADYFLSEKTNNKDKTFSFSIENDKWVVFKIIFDNDIYEKNKDRNVLIYNIALNRQK